jgi:hypothetical protein
MSNILVLEQAGKMTPEAQAKIADRQRKKAAISAARLLDTDARWIGPAFALLGTAHRVGIVGVNGADINVFKKRVENVVPEHNLHILPALGSTHGKAVSGEEEEARLFTIKQARASGPFGVLLIHDAFFKRDSSRGTPSIKEEINSIIKTQNSEARDNVAFDKREAPALMITGEGSSADLTVSMAQQGACRYGKGESSIGHSMLAEFGVRIALLPSGQMTADPSDDYLIKAFSAHPDEPPKALNKLYLPHLYPDLNG